MSLYKAQFEQVITDTYFASFILSQSLLVFRSKQDKEKQKIDVIKEEKEKGLEFIKEKYGAVFLTITLIILGKQEPFHNHNKNICFELTVVEKMSDCEWWNSF